MNKSREYLKGIAALVLMAYGIGLVLREAVWERVFGDSRRYPLYSGLFVLFTMKINHGNS